MVCLRVLVADKGTVIMQWLTELLPESDSIQIVGCAHRPAETLAAVEGTHPDVLLLDQHMPGDTLTCLLRLLKMSQPAPVIVVLADYPSAVLKSRSLCAGADHVFTKTTELESVAILLRELAEKRLRMRRRL